MSATVMEAVCEPINDRRVNMVGSPAVATSGSNLTTMLPSKNKLSNVYIKLSVEKRKRNRENKWGHELVDQKKMRIFCSCSLTWLVGVVERKFTKGADAVAGIQNKNGFGRVGE